VDALVTAYNDAMNIFDELTNAKSTLDTYGGTMVGNSTINTLRTQLRALVTQDSSSKALSGELEAFRDIGIEVDSHGLLKSNSVKLDLALNTDFANTVALLSGNQENQSLYDPAKAGLAGDGSKAITKMLSTTSTIAKETANANTRITKDQDDLAALEDRMAKLLARYTKQFSSMDSIVGQSRSTQTGLTSTFAGMMAMYTKN
jgi:flagellar hook-associated protein 2